MRGAVPIADGEELGADAEEDGGAETPSAGAAEGVDEADGVIDAGLVPGLPRGPIDGGHGRLLRVHTWVIGGVRRELSGRGRFTRTSLHRRALSAEIHGKSFGVYVWLRIADKLGTLARQSCWRGARFRFRIVASFSGGFRRGFGIGWRWIRFSVLRIRFDRTGRSTRIRTGCRRCS